MFKVYNTKLIDMSKTVLVIDDAGFDRTIIVALLNQSGFEIVGEADNGLDGIALAKELNPDIITLDKLMPGLDGMQVLQKLRDQNIQSEVVLVSGDELDSIRDAAEKLGVKCFLNKPVTRTELIEEFSKF